MERWIEKILEEPVWGSKMRFVAGPRQCGKTTLAGAILERHCSSALLARPLPSAPEEEPRHWIEERLYPPAASKAAGEAPGAREAFDQLSRFGPFPEPLLRSNARFAAVWRRSYLDSVIRGDLRDLSRLRDLDLVETLVRLLPWRGGAPFSANAMREDLEVSQPTVSP